MGGDEQSEHIAVAGKPNVHMHFLLGFENSQGSNSFCYFDVQVTGETSEPQAQLTND